MTWPNEKIWEVPKGTQPSNDRLKGAEPLTRGQKLPITGSHNFRSGTQWGKGKQKPLKIEYSKTGRIKNGAQHSRSKVFRERWKGSH